MTIKEIIESNYDTDETIGGFYVEFNHSTIATAICTEIEKMFIDDPVDNPGITFISSAAWQKFKKNNGVDVKS